MANENKFGDDRLVKKSGADSRASRDGADVDRVQSDGLALSAAERRRMLRQDWVQEVLPTPPAIPGFHLCWVSTTNSTDPVHKRIQLGYQPVKASELPGFDQYKINGGTFDGCVSCNEMILFKIPMDVYQDLMMIYHHDIPLEQEQSIRERINDGLRGSDSDGRNLGTVEGDFNSLGRAPARAPAFHG